MSNYLINKFADIRKLATQYTVIPRVTNTAIKTRTVIQLLNYVECRDMSRLSSKVTRISSRASSRTSSKGTFRFTHDAHNTSFILVHRMSKKDK